MAVSPKYYRRWALALIIASAVVGLFAIGIQRLHFEADILSSLPQHDPVVADAGYILTNHPIYDRVAVDLAHDGGNLEVLEKGALLVETEMRRSSLFKEVGFQRIGQLMPEIMVDLARRLPTLFSEAELESEIKPLLTREGIHRTLSEHAASLRELGGIGGSGLIAADPLGLRWRVLSRLSSLAPSQGARFAGDRLLSADGKHILIVAEPASAGTDTRYAERIAALMTGIEKELKGKGGLVLTPVGAYRAALDNERSAKSNVQKAVLFSTVGIAILLLVGFPRPLIGLLALLPAFAGTMLAFFVYSLFYRSISLMSVGFSGAIISFTVDYGIAYLLFLDRPHETRGLEATRKVWSLGFLAMLTTAVSFAFLSLSGFRILVEIGIFSALGVVFTYIFVHAVFPLVFPVLRPARRPALLPLRRFVNRIASANGTWKVYAALAFGIFMLFFASPQFRVDLNAMSTVSEETKRADRLIRDVWGDIFSKVYLMIEGRDGPDLQSRCDRVADLLEKETQAGRISQSFTLSSIYPGEDAAGSREAAWRKFWTPDRVAEIRKALGDSSRILGFSQDAFAPFLKLLDNPDLPGTFMPEKYAALLGVKVNQDGSARAQVVSLTPGPAYDSEDFYNRFTTGGQARVFDPALFSKRLGSLLQFTFLQMAAIVGIATFLTAFFYFLDWRLTLLGIAPILFSIVCTLGTLNLLGEPLGIPTLMVAVVVIGMGSDYGLYLIRAYQRYIDENDPELGLIRFSVFLSFATTFLGFCVLALSDNAVLRSTGLGLSLGIGYAFLGAITITPPLLKKIYAPKESGVGETVMAGSKEHLRRTLARYRHMEAYRRFFARFKIRLDPMFPRLAGFMRNPKIIVDVGTGYGVPAAWLLELFPGARLYGIEPDRERVRTAARVIGARGAVTRAAAPDLPELSDKADTALILDVVHMLSDDDLRLTLKRLSEKIRSDAILVMRTALPSGERVPWLRRIETARVRLSRGAARFRTREEILTILSESGFEVIATERSSPDREDTWFIAELKRQERIAGTPTAAGARQ